MSTLSEHARFLRKNMTKEERRLWYDFLKSLPMTVHRQKVIDPYIVDFYIAQAKLVIELDGSQHYEAAHQQADRNRDAFLTRKGLTVLRYSNLEINRQFDAVCQDILSHIAAVFPSSGPAGHLPPRGKAEPSPFRRRGTAEGGG